MKKLFPFLGCLLLLTASAFAQVHRDTDPVASSGIDYMSLGIGLVVGLLIGYVLGSRGKK